jgi:hypothetical protein
MAVEIVGCFQRIAIQQNDGVQCCACFVVRLDACEVLLNERAAAQRAVAEGGLDLGYGAFVDCKLARRLAGKHRGGESDTDSKLKNENWGIPKSNFPISQFSTFQFTVPVLREPASS